MEPDIENAIFIDKQVYLKFLENKIDGDIGFYFWKKYIAAAFWAQISMPMNLTITILTALTTAQATSPDLLPESTFFKISVATLLITVLNTFFTPQKQLNKQSEIMNKWNEMGTKFEEIYYSLDKMNESKIFEVIEKYRKLQESINEIRQTEGPDTINFVTDLIHLISLKSCLLKHNKWLSYDRKLRKKNADKILKANKECCYSCYYPNLSDETSDLVNEFSQTENNEYTQTENHEYTQTDVLDESSNT